MAVTAATDVQAPAAQTGLAEVVDDELVARLAGQAVPFGNSATGR
jgi:hypothetical protein